MQETKKFPHLAINSYRVNSKRNTEETLYSHYIKNQCQNLYAVNS